MGDGTKVQFKIFFGTLSDDDVALAEVRVNEWLEEERAAGYIINIVRWQYQQARYGDHSICIEYERYRG